MHLREASERTKQVQVRDPVRQVRIEARSQRKVLREQHRHSVRPGPHRGLGRSQEAEVRVVQRLREGGDEATDQSLRSGGCGAQLQR